MITLHRQSLQLLFFSSIGASAALTHLIVVLNLVSYLSLDPLIANIIAFFIAFNISYLGHKHLTFAQIGNDKELSLPHFFFVASSAGILNELLYFLLLRFTDIHYLVGLTLILGLVSVYNFFLSRFWACR